jgi:hypothetical protein
MSKIAAALMRWQIDLAGVRERMYRSPTPRERERWHALWLLAQEWPAVKVADALERDPHTVGDWLAEFIKGGPEAVAFVQTGGPPPPSSLRSRPL